MHSIILALAGCAMLCATTARADALYNLRASLQNGYYVAGTARVDAVAGVVTDESATLYRNGVALATFGSPGSQGAFAPAGLAPSYLFGSAGTGGYLFVGAVPGTTLVGYTGSELCGTASVTRCAFADLFMGGVPLANVVQGVLAAAGDTIRTFDLAAVFADGGRVTGSVTIDTTIGFVLDERATLFSGGVVVDTFDNPLGQSPFSPAGLAPSFLFQSIGAQGVLLNIATPWGSLIDYGGGDICATGTALNCAFSNIFAGPIASNAVSGRLTLRGPATVPEPASLALVLTGAIAALVGRRRRATRD